MLGMSRTFGANLRSYVSCKDSSPAISNVVVNGSPTGLCLSKSQGSRFTGKGYDSFYGRVSARGMDLSGPYTQSL